MSFKSIKGWKRYVLIYVVALALSHLVTAFLERPQPDQENPNNTVQLKVVNADQSLSDKEITISYQDVYTGSEDNPPVILLLPGGPDGPEEFQQIVPSLSSKMRVLIPHLPGYGSGNENLPSYSFKSSSLYTSQFLDTLNISSVHVFGFGLGGPSAIHLAHDHPQKIASVGLIASVGVQELELLGSYRLNHAVHGMQLGAVWLLYNGIPHFGLFKAIDIDVSYARRHYETDQRPLRSHLQQLEKPAIILHGKEDPLVPLAAAQEHYRIVPQSKLQLYNTGHDLLETHSDSVSQTIKSFIAKVEEGTATTAANASKERIKEAKKSFSNVEFAKFEGISLLIILLIIILGTLISEDLTCIGAGLLVARGLIGFWPATLACFLGILIGDVGLYVAGRVLGRPAIKRAPLKWIISEKDLEKSAQWFKVKGPAIIIATRFLPGSRMPTYFSAGIIKAGFWMFIFYFILAGLVWTPMLVGISKLLGNELLRYFAVYQDYAIWVLLGGIAFIMLFIKLIIPAFSYKGRRLLLSRYRKLTRWQYWRPIIIYTPVTIYIIYLGIRYRCLTLFTAVNPAIPDGGFVGESKSAILDLFKDSAAVATYKKISLDEEFENMVNNANQFLKENNLNFPIVLKPDIGERGKGVEIIRDRYAMQDYLSECSGDIIIQEFVEGKEIGIFYYRKPQEERGHIFSITKKQLPKLVGDGQKTVQELILSDDVTVNMGKEYLKQNEERLYSIPDDGEPITLVDIGTHAQGAIFFDGKELVTEALTKRMNKICNAVTGFQFGRFDIRVPDYEQLQKGRELKIIEVNGVTSESTNIYDERYSLIDGQSILMEQWEVAFEIGDQLRKKGRNVSSLLPFLKRVFNQIVKAPS